MANLTNVRAARIEQSILPQLPLASLCSDFVNGFCRRGEGCTKSHEICAVSETLSPSTLINSSPNFLRLDPRGSLHAKHFFEEDGPGRFSRIGPRHDNDHVNIQDIRILPTADEILCRRHPYMPKKDQSSIHHLACGQERLLDIHFRQLRYESTEAIIDCCYHASQRLVELVTRSHELDYDDRMSTPRGCRYSLFRDIAVEELSFNFQKGVTLRVSFACPKALRGLRMGPSKHLEEGMLVALIGLEKDQSLSTTFMEIYQRQTTFAMRPRTGNDLRGRLQNHKLMHMSDFSSLGRTVFCGPERR